MAQYWLLDWMDVEGIKTLDDATKALQSNSLFDRFVERVKQESVGNMEPIPAAYEQIVAGMGVDLSGAFDCIRAQCIIERVDHLVRRTWHYFDTVVVTGLDPLRLSIEPGNPIFWRQVFNHIEVALYVRNSGVEPFLTFSPKPPYCEKHLDEHGREAGLAPITKVADEFSRIIRKGVQMKELGIRHGKRVVSFTHPLLNTMQERQFGLSEKIHSGKASKKWAADYARSYAAHLIGDATLARVNHAALGRLAIVKGDKLPKGRQKATVADAAFNLSVPYIDSLPVKELLAVREHEASDFQAFRAALRSAIEVRIRALPQADSEQVAKSVIDDVIEPALIDLDRKLMRASDALLKRSAAAIGIGTVLTTVGLLAFAPLVAPGIIVGAGGLLANFNDYLKDCKEVKLSDMHFLWHLSERSVSHVGRHR